MDSTPQTRLELDDPIFRDRLNQLERRRRQVQSEHDGAWRDLTRVDPSAVQEQHQAWLRYCDVVMEFEKMLAEFETLRVGA